MDGGHIAAIVVPLLVLLLLFMIYMWHRRRSGRAGEQGAASPAAFTSAMSDDDITLEVDRDSKAPPPSSSFSPKEAWARGVGKAGTVVAMAGPHSPWRVKTEGSNIIVDVDWKGKQ